MTVAPVRLVTPGDRAWDEARGCWNLAVDQRPAAVAFPESAAEVGSLVRHAAAEGMRIAFQGGGHNTAPIGWSERVLLLRTNRMRGIEIDAAARRARIDAGVLSDELTAAAAARGLAFLAGTSPDVGVVGYALGGGLSWLTRKYGLACNSIVGAEVVTADGRLLRVDREHEPDLFWALRGGGGNFAAVTALELALLPLAEVDAGALFWPIERAVEVLSAWREWTATVPEACTSLGRLLKLPDAEEVSPRLRGRSFVLVELCVAGDAAPLVDPLRRLDPELDTVATISPTGLSAINMDPPNPVPYRGEGIHLRAFDVAAVAALVEAFVPSALLHAEVRHLGGAAARGSAAHGALDRIDAPYTTMSFGLTPDAESEAAVLRDLARLYRALAPWDAGSRYLNFTESPVDARLLFPAPSYERLCAVRARYDPRGLFRANHCLG
ncbi:MAG TPA: FAD-binding protein [Gaiellaceae bacterium]|nr:FAD-binding protein [Gaiellaceae bacterium]